ncbi:DNA/RNA nuclease SfsA [Clostridium sp. MSJ-4]|uniref:Sugar fermentation stimulation protein homolog n=1 Tax=Clostridium simiarum TaxID=2841506 RepID=A0ABS6F4M3_9CLOT|nr:DNA/RNA nuclease SfsA [Clostridium simiarum]MBU5593477.1 DNA/RNA nuclease SfsA [Clostridium simiarum]
MIIDKNIKLAKFIRRPNRFQAYVELDGEELMVHVPNTGRCREILIPGVTVVLREESNPSRKTPYDLIAGYKDNKLINIDSQIPNKVVEEALRNGSIEELINYKDIKREKTFGNSRFDFKLMDEFEYFLEVKGVTLEKEGITKFPDAPTERGTKHLLELVQVKKTGRGAGVLFLIQMENAKIFKPHDEMDKNFGEALRFAYSKGVDVMAYDCIVREDLISLNNKVEVIL